MSSLFGNQGTGGPSSGGLFGGLSVNTNADSGAKRKQSIFDPSTSRSETQAQPGLFSTTNTTQASTPSLFGNMPASTQAPLSFGKPATSASGSSLFGAPTTSAPSAGLFGAATTPASTGGLFGSAPATSAPSGGLFSSTTANAPSGGLFGSKPATSAPSNTPSGLTLFGSGAPASTTQPGASMGASMFGASQPSAQQSQQDGQQTEAPKVHTKDGGYFSTLLERQKKKARLHQAEPNGRKGQLPALNMDLGDLARRAQEIGGRGGMLDSQVSDSRAHYLLAGSGVSPGKAYRDFQALDDDDMQTDSGAPFPDASVETETYIKNLQTKGRDAMMRESIDRVYREVDQYIEETLGIDFEEQKLRIMKHFGLISEDDELEADNGTPARSLGKSTRTTHTGTRSVFGRSAMNKSIIGTPGAISGTSSFFKGDNTVKAGSLLRGQSARDLRDKERLFVDQVQSLNRARLEGESFPIMTRFGEVEAKAAGDSPAQLVDTYSALREITKEGTTTTERQFAAQYLGENRLPTQLSLQILNGSRTYLEKAFYREVESQVDKNPREAQLGGRPSVINKVRAYIRVRAARRSLGPDGTELQQIGESGDYCWILIFILIRCGFTKEAAEYVNNDTAFQSTDRRFVSYMSTYANSPDRRLSRKLQEMIDGEYQQRAKLAPKGTVDPYRMACYKVVGRCDLASRNLETVGQGVEDWLWLQFALARQQLRDEEVTGELFGLEQIQETIAEIGDKHFQKGQVEGSNAYGTFFFMQLLAGMFEPGIEYLHTFNPVSAVHFAIALSYYGLLRASDFNVAGNELLTKSTTEQYQINFVPLIAHYTATFRTALPVAAVDYLCLICLNSDLKPTSLGKMQTKACHECLRELCLESREFAMLLGDIRSDGSRIPGAIEQRARLIKIESRDEYLRSITTQSAAVADQRGQVADAVLLYHLCEDYDNVVKVLNRALADAISLDLGDSPMQLEPLKPRQQEQAGSPSTVQSGPVSSLSLTQSSSSVVELASRMRQLYNSDAAYYHKINSESRDTCGALLKLLEMRAELEANPPRYMSALESLNELDIIPLNANGSIPMIRGSATAFGTLPQLVARSVGVSIVWAVRAIGGERDVIVRHGSWETGYGGDRDQLKYQLSSMAKDLMVFAGLVKYKLPARVYDLLTKAGSDVGSF